MSKSYVTRWSTPGIILKLPISLSPSRYYKYMPLEMDVQRITQLLHFLLLIEIGNKFDLPPPTPSRSHSWELKQEI